MDALIEDGEIARKAGRELVEYDSTETSGKGSLKKMESGCKVLIIKKKKDEKAIYQL